MKYNYNPDRSLTILLGICLFSISGYAASAEVKTHHAVSQRNASAQSAEPARLIIHRIPNLGNNVVVNLYVDGAPFGVAGYDQTLDKTLPAGRHLLSVAATPNPRDDTRSATAVDLESGKTYTFTAVDNGSGKLVLK